MDTKITIYKPLFHEHPLFSSARFVITRCGGCHVTETMYGGYYCNDPNCYDWFFHKDCAEAPLEVIHPSHPKHPLLLTNDKDSGEGLCDFCGENLSPPCYSCSNCEFKVGFNCGIKPLPLYIEHPMCHDHPLVFYNIQVHIKHWRWSLNCVLCNKYISGPSYSCLECNDVSFHLDCIHFSKQVSHPCHYDHLLKLVASNTLTDDATEKTCVLCELEQEENMIYHCSICNFATCLYCTRNPPPLLIEHTNTHKHTLTLFPKKISFTCDVCGEEGNMGPYLCLQCGFVIHGKCIHLPRLININRHDHRISFTNHLGDGYSKCGICRKILSQYHGAYSCSLCPSYAVHSRCAIKTRIWDFVELEGTQDDTEDVAPFKVVGDDLINHFSHETHPLKLYKNYIHPNEWLPCEACINPLGFDPIYKCEECSFVLHEKCANLPRKKRLVFQAIPYTMEVDTEVLDCMQCKVISLGFTYTSQENEERIDIHCGSLAEPFLHDGHLHPLYFHKDYEQHCDGCSSKLDYGSYTLQCDSCAFNLCFYCACLPKKIWYKNDEHLLTLYCGKMTRDNNWCDNCEKKLDPCKWFYTCSDCEITLHARCVLGDFSRLKLKKTILVREEEQFEAISNNRNTRPLCSTCDSRCHFSIILKNCDEDNKYICSRYCLINRF